MYGNGYTLDYFSILTDVTEGGGVIQIGVQIRQFLSCFVSFFFCAQAVKVFSFCSFLPFIHSPFSFLPLCVVTKVKARLVLFYWKQVVTGGKSIARVNKCTLYCSSPTEGAMNEWMDLQVLIELAQKRELTSGDSRSDCFCSAKERQRVCVCAIYFLWG